MASAAAKPVEPQAPVFLSWQGDHPAENFKKEYAEAFTIALQDPRIFEHLPENVPDLDDINKLIQWFIERDLKNKTSGFIGTNFAVFIKSTKIPIG